MLITSILGLMVVLLSFLARKVEFRFFLKWAWALIFIFLALRKDFGNDYATYKEMFDGISVSFNSFDFLENTRWSDQKINGTNIEPGWFVINLIFSKFGFHYMLAVLALFYCCVYYRFIKKYVNPDHYWLTMFIFVFSSEHMLVQSSAMRQSVAICCFILSIDYLLKKNILIYLFWIVLGATFHTSLLAMLPLCGLVLFKKPLNKMFAVSLFLIFIISAFNIKYYVDYIQSLLGIIGMYRRYSEIGAELNSGYGLVYWTFILGCCLYVATLKTTTNYKLLFVYIKILTFFIIIFGFAVQAVSRLGMYMDVVALSILPYVLYSFKYAPFKYGLIFSYILVTLYSYFVFFTSDIWRDAFLNYHSIFYDF